MRFMFLEDEEEDENHVLSVFRTLCDNFIQFFCMQLLFDMFSTLMSLELKLKVKTAIMLDHPWQSLYTQYYRTV